jgi:hypothetical protein
LRTYGANFLTNINLGSNADAISDLTFHATTEGAWLPDATGGTRDPDGAATYGTPTTGNLAFSLQRVSPLTGPLNTPPYDAAQLTTDIGRGVMTDVAGLFSTRGFNVPVTNGQFDTFWLTLSSAFGARINLSEPITGTEYGPGVLSQAQEVALFGSPGTTNNTYSYLAGAGVISRAGPAYVLDLPFYGHESTFFVPIDISAHLRAIANLRVGDVNFDGAVNSADRILVQSHLGETNAQGLGVGDANGDGVVNSADLALVPEPATAIGFACGIAVLAFAARTQRR